MPSRGHHRSRLPLLVCVLLLAACTGSAEPSTTTGAATTTSTIHVTTTTFPDTLGCPEDPDFVDRGRVVRVDQPTSDTNRVGLISWQVDEGCERFGLEFETAEGAPATTPPTVVVDFLPSRQILRVWTDVDATVLSDQLVETPLVSRLYVVRGLEGGMFIDFHLTAPAFARVAITNSPARMSLELHAASDPLTAPAVVADRVVVVTPSVASETPTEIEVTGYARVFEANVLLVATMGSEVVAEESTIAADSTATWGEFRAPMTLPQGPVSLFVGEQSPEDGALHGANLDLTVR